MTGPRKQYVMVMEAIDEGSNTTRDVCDVTGLDVNTVSSLVSKMVADGMLRRTGRSVPNLNAARQGRRYQVFEPVVR